MDSETMTYLKNVGYMDKSCILVKSNVFDIPKRLAEINPDYFVVFNPHTQLFELHDSSRKITHTLTFPFDELDGRCLDYTKERLIERSDVLFKKMREQNRKLELDADNKFLDEVNEASKDIYNYAVRKSIDGEINTGKKVC